MQVTQETKEAFRNNEVKHLYVKLIEKDAKDYDEEKDEYIEREPKIIVIDESNIVADSMKLTEAVMESGNFLVSGCISKTLEIDFAMLDLYTLSQLVIYSKDWFLDVSIQAGDSEIIPLFRGNIDSVDRSRSEDVYTVKAYDDFYSYNDVKINMESLISHIEEEYGLTYPCSFKELWQYIFEDLFKYDFSKYSATLDPNFNSMHFAMDNIEIDYTPEPLDNLEIDGEQMYWFRTYLNVKTNAFELISFFCQVNGVMAIIDRNNHLTFRNDNNWKSETDAEEVEFFKNLSVGDASSYPRSVVIYNSNQESVYSDGLKKGSSLYEISGNVVTDLMLYDTSGAGSILDSIGQEWSARKYNMTTIGMPYLECGIDKVKVGRNSIYGYVGYVFPIVRRELTGIQNLTDTFVYDVNTDFDKMTRSMQRRIANLEASKPSAKYVTETPTDFENNTIYFVRKQ